MQPQTFVYVTGKIEKANYGDSLFMKVVKVDFLADVLKHGTIRSVTFTIDLEKLDAPLVEQFTDILIKNKIRPAFAPSRPDADAKPQVPVRFHIVDRTRKMDVSLSSSTYSVELGQEVIKMVDANSDAVVMSVNDR